MERKGNRIAERQLGARSGKCSTHHCASCEEATYTPTAYAIAMGGRRSQSHRGRKGGCKRASKIFIS